MSYYREFWRCTHCLGTYLSWIAMPWPDQTDPTSSGEMIFFPEPHSNCMGGRLHVVGLYVYTSLDQTPESPTLKLL